MMIVEAEIGRGWSILRVPKVNRLECGIVQGLANIP